MNKKIIHFLKPNVIAPMVLAVAVGVFWAGCVSVGGPFNTSQVPSIAIGKTTQDGIVKMFGQPFRTGVEDGDTTWTYVNYQFGFGAQPVAKDLFIRFDSTSKVKSYSFNAN